MEEWRDIEGYEGYYQISNMGRVKSLERTVRCNRGYRIVPEKIMKAGENDYGYLRVELYKEGSKEQPLVHVLVATAFLDNADNLPEVNHKDENPKNNCVENLEWCNRSYNVNYGTRNKKVSEKMTNNPKLSKSILGINKISGLIVDFPSIMEASRQTGIDQGNITRCCKGKLKSAGGYYWMYSDSEEVANEQE